MEPTGSSERRVEAGRGELPLLHVMTFQPRSSCCPFVRRQAAYRAPRLSGEEGSKESSKEGGEKNGEKGGGELSRHPSAFTSTFASVFGERRTGSSALSHGLSSSGSNDAALQT